MLGPLLAAVSLLGAWGAAAVHPRMTDEEKILWWCEQHPGPNCEAEGRLSLPYISDYAKYDDVDNRGQPLEGDESGCDFSPKPPGCPDPERGPNEDPRDPGPPAPPTPPTPPTPPGLPAPPPPAGCSTDGSGAPSLGAGHILLTISRGGHVPLRMKPPFPAKSTEISTAQSTSSYGDLKAELAVSRCVGDFDKTPVACRAWGTVYMGALRLMVRWGPAGGGAAGCVLDPSKGPYYVNVRNVKFDGKTPDCPVGQCYMWVNFNWN